jgi:hypothetical protein
MNYREAEKSQDMMLKMLMQLEYMTATLDVVEIIMEKIYKKPDDTGKK